MPIGVERPASTDANRHAVATVVKKPHYGGTTLGFVPQAKPSHHSAWGSPDGPSAPQMAAARWYPRETYHGVSGADFVGLFDAQSITVQPVTFDYGGSSNTEEPRAHVAHGTATARSIVAPRKLSQAWRFRPECAACVREAFEAAHDTRTGIHHTHKGPCACAGCAAVYALHGRCDIEAHKPETAEKQAVYDNTVETKTHYAPGYGPRQSATRYRLPWEAWTHESTWTRDDATAALTDRLTEARAAWSKALRDGANGQRSERSIALHAGALGAKYFPFAPSNIGENAPVGYDSALRSLASHEAEIKRLESLISEASARPEIVVTQHSGFAWHMARSMPERASVTRRDAGETAPRIALTRHAIASIAQAEKAFAAWSTDHAATCRQCHRAECPASARRAGQTTVACPYGASRSKRALLARRTRQAAQYTEALSQHANTPHASTVAFVATSTPVGTYTRTTGVDAWGTLAAPTAPARLVDRGAPPSAVEAPPVASASARMGVHRRKGGRAVVVEASPARRR